MIQNRSCVNGILAAVLSASILPIHGALAKEKSPVAQKAVAKKLDAPAHRKIEKQDLLKDETAKPDAGGAAPPATISQ